MDKLTKAQRDILLQANTFGRVDAYMQQRRPVENLRERGLLKKVGLVEHKITEAGRVTLTNGNGDTAT